MSVYTYNMRADGPSQPLLFDLVRFIMHEHDITTWLGRLRATDQVIQRRFLAFSLPTTFQSIFSPSQGNERNDRRDMGRSTGYFHENP